MRSSITGYSFELSHGMVELQHRIAFFSLFALWTNSKAQTYLCKQSVYKIKIYFFAFWFCFVSFNLFALVFANVYFFAMIELFLLLLIFGCLSVDERISFLFQKIQRFAHHKNKRSMMNQMTTQSFMFGIFVFFFGIFHIL